MHTQKFHSTKFPKKKTWKTTPHGQLQWWNDAWRRSLARQNETAEATSQPGGQRKLFPAVPTVFVCLIFVFLSLLLLVPKKQNMYIFADFAHTSTTLSSWNTRIWYGFYNWFYRYLLKGLPGSTMLFLQKRGVHAGNTMEFFLGAILSIFLSCLSTSLGVKHGEIPYPRTLAMNLWHWMEKA